MEVDAEAGTQGRRQEAATRRSPDEREGIEVDLYGAGTGALVQHDIDAIVLHRGVEVLLHDGTEAMDLVDEEHIVGLEGGQEPREIPGLIEHWARGDLDADPKLRGDDV